MSVFVYVKEELNILDQAAHWRFRIRKLLYSNARSLQRRQVIF